MTRAAGCSSSSGWRIEPRYRGKNRRWARGDEGSWRLERERMRGAVAAVVAVAALSALGAARAEGSGSEPEGNCSEQAENECEEFDMVDYVMDQIKIYHWLLIALHSLVFFVGLVGNSLVCLAVYRNHSMRTVTNYFIVNLAVADLLVIIICLPPTVVWDITLTWFLGDMPCKIVLYLQTVAVTVSVLTLTFISIDRWYAICFPLRLKSTTSRAKTAIIVIWVVALLFDIPELLVMQTFEQPDLPKGWNVVLYTQCGPSWGQGSQIAFTVTKFLLLYTLPLIFMSFAYCRIVRVLWNNDIPGHNLSTRIINTNELSSQANFGNPEGQLKSRRKAAKMLVAVVLMFAICCLPVHLYAIFGSLLRMKGSSLVRIIVCFVHWLLYANSAINPLIYNFMSGKFRKEFKRTFCCPGRDGARGRSVYRMAGMSRLPGHSRSSPNRAAISRFINKNVLINNNVRHYSTEVVPLSSGAVCLGSSNHQPAHHSPQF